MARSVLVGTSLDPCTPCQLSTRSREAEYRPKGETIDKFIFHSTFNVGM